ncbi:hypothetical protein E1301_Tti014486 [Triplophysa tibetana]|uniref:Uncharacterized protein n=1 Tax=Triplophysa tibetana TaxID=1572043 RepID=A0A5A9PKB8_9TELE|nr:hypothetical protein E1301_Tti014486 [Triplophysa tibetana]
MDSQISFIPIMNDCAAEAVLLPPENGRQDEYLMCKDICVWGILQLLLVKQFKGLDMDNIQHTHCWVLLHKDCPSEQWERANSLGQIVTVCDQVPGKAGRDRLERPGKAGRDRLERPGKAGRDRLERLGNAGRDRLERLGNAGRDRLERLGNAGRDRLQRLRKAGRDRLERLRKAGRDRLERPWKAGRDRLERPWKAGRDRLERPWKAGRDRLERPGKAGRDRLERPWKAGRDRLERPWKAGRDRPERLGNAGRDRLERLRKAGRDRLREQVPFNLLPLLGGGGVRRGSGMSRNEPLACDRYWATPAQVLISHPDAELVAGCLEDSIYEVLQPVLICIGKHDEDEQNVVQTGQKGQV